MARLTDQLNQLNIHLQTSDVHTFASPPTVRKMRLKAAKLNPRELRAEGIDERDEGRKGGWGGTVG